MEIKGIYLVIIAIIIVGSSIMSLGIQGLTNVKSDQIQQDLNEQKQFNQSLVLYVQANSNATQTLSVIGTYCKTELKTVDDVNYLSIPSCLIPTSALEMK